MNDKKFFGLFVLIALVWLFVLCSVAFGQTPDPMKDIRYAGIVQRGPDGATQRSTSVIAAFKRQWACPSNGNHSGVCPGWAIDHIVPLDCGGVDAVWNMQWLPDQIKSAKGPYSKDHFERRVYGGHKLSAGCP